MESDLRGDGSIDVYAPRRGVTLRIAGAPVDTARSLVAEDLAAWSAPPEGGRRRLAITATGMAHLARSDAGEDNKGFRAQHGDIIEQAADAGSSRRGLQVNRSESPLAWLANRKGANGKPLLETSAYQAGERLRADIERAQMLPRVTANWTAHVASSARGAGSMDYSDMAIAARQRVDAALEAVGPEFSGLLLDVCGFLKGLETVEAERGWPRRSARVVLQMALARLAAHYGLHSAARGPERSHGLRRWGAEGYRPRVSDPVPEGE